MVSSGNFLLLAIGTIASGLYPAVVLSSFKPSSILRGKFGNSTGGINLRKALVVFQFAVAFILVTSTLTVYKQLSFMQGQDLGFDVEQTLVVKAPRNREGDYGSKVQTLKEVLGSNSSIEKICHVTEVPGRQLYWDAGGIYKVGDDATDSKNYHIVGIDYDFIDFFNMSLTHGRTFAKEYPADTSSLMLNEAAVAYMGFESNTDAVGKEVSYWGQIFKVVGVVKNYHQQSLREDYEPLIYRLMPEGRGVRGQIVIKFNSKNVKEVVAETNKMYAKFFPGNPFDFFFLDEYFDQQYRADFLFGKVVGIFALLAIIITALGIFGLSSYNAIQKTKEIGIRKVLGAEVTKIVYMLSREFVILMLIAFAVSIPLLIYGLNLFLNDFAFRMELSPLLFVLPMVGVALIALLSIGYQYLKAATMNPAVALRNE
jgi:putative ABC transport system permease protein